MQNPLLLLSVSWVLLVLVSFFAYFHVMCLVCKAFAFCPSTRRWNNTAVTGQELRPAQTQPARWDHGSKVSYYQTKQDLQRWQKTNNKQPRKKGRDRHSQASSSLQSVLPFQQS